MCGAAATRPADVTPGTDVRCSRVRCGCASVNSAQPASVIPVQPSRRSSCGPEAKKVWGVWGGMCAADTEASRVR
eukprot:366055-Chlamydomonas_euryale.AAC.25